MRKWDTGGDAGLTELRLGEPGGADDLAGHVVVEVCRCGCTPRDDDRAAEAPDWPLAVAWAWLTRPTAEQLPAVQNPPVDGADTINGRRQVGDAGVLDDAGEQDLDDLPWWDAGARRRKRRAVLPLVLLGELQAGVLLRALYEVVKGKTGAAL